VSKGIAPTRLVYKGYGETQPIASNTTEEDRAKNRRTVFMIITK
jgi:outer membrane protein OmpA-like peptidoglycan-associated protein